MIDTYVVGGDDYAIVEKGFFSSKRLVWLICDGGADNYIVVIPLEYGKEEVERILKEEYELSHYLSLWNDAIIVIIKESNISLPELVEILKRF